MHSDVLSTHQRKKCSRFALPTLENILLWKWHTVSPIQSCCRKQLKASFCLHSSSNMHGETGKAIRVFTIHHARLAGREKGTYSHDRESVVLVALVTAASVASHVILACTLRVSRGIIACFVTETTPSQVAVFCLTARSQHSDVCVQRTVGFCGEVMCDKCAVFVCCWRVTLYDIFPLKGDKSIQGDLTDRR